MNKINFLDSVDWSFPVPISYGPNRINELPDICKTNNLIEEIDQNKYEIQSKNNNDVWFVHTRYVGEILDP